MGQLIKPQQVNVITKDGELLVHIMLDINLNLGDIKSSVTTKDKQEVEDEKTSFIIPEFTSGRVKFGKEEKPS